jgi:hypothetical protein
MVNVPTKAWSHALYLNISQSNHWATWGASVILAMLIKFKQNHVVKKSAEPSDLIRRSRFNQGGFWWEDLGSAMKIKGWKKREYMGVQWTGARMIARVYKFMERDIPLHFQKKFSLLHYFLSLGSSTFSLLSLLSLKCSWYFKNRDESSSLPAYLRRGLYFPVAAPPPAGILFFFYPDFFLTLIYYF